MISGTPYSLICGDCLHALAQIPEQSVDFIFADPPFNAGKVYGSGQYDDNRPQAQYLAWLKDRLAQFALTLKPGGTLWLMNDTRWIGYCQVYLDELGLTFLNQIVWAYTNPTPAKNRYPKTWRPILLYCKGDRPRRFEANACPLTRGTLYYDPVRARTNFVHDLWADIPKLVGGVFAQEELLTDKAGRFAHPAQMPEAIARRAVLTATQPGEVVLDPFMGSGTVGAAAVKAGRRFIGIDLEQSYVQLAAQRLAEILPAEILPPEKYIEVKN